MNKSGFTLLELVIAAAILIMALLGLLRIYIGCFNLNETARNLTAAINGAQKEMERIHSLAFSSISAGTFEIDAIAGADSEGIVEVCNADPELLVVTVTVCWRQRNGRIIGENSDLDDGVFDLVTEDENGNGRLDSPAQIVTLVADHD